MNAMIVNQLEVQATGFYPICSKRYGLSNFDEGKCLGCLSALLAPVNLEDCNTFAVTILVRAPNELTIRKVCSQHHFTLQNEKIPLAESLNEADKLATSLLTAMKNNLNDGERPYFERFYNQTVMIAYLYRDGMAIPTPAAIPLLGELVRLIYYKP